VPRIIGWLIICNSWAIMLQSLCENIHKALEFSSDKDEERHPRKLQSKSLGTYMV
jgi:hypothetical protein